MDFLDYSSLYYIDVYKRDAYIRDEKVYIDDDGHVIAGRMHELPIDGKAVCICGSTSGLYMLMDDGTIYKDIFSRDHIIGDDIIKCRLFPINVIDIIKIRTSYRIALVLDDGSLLDEVGDRIYKFDDIVLEFWCRYNFDDLSADDIYEPIRDGAYARMIDGTVYEYNSATHSMRMLNTVEL